MDTLLNTVLTDEADIYALIVYSQTIEVYFYLCENPCYLRYYLCLINGNAGFSKFSHWFVDSGAINVFSKNILKVLLILFRHADYCSFVGRYNRHQIAREGELFPQQVSSCIKQLTFAGVVEKTKKKKTFYYKLATKPTQELLNYLSFYSTKTIKTNKNRDPHTGRYKKANTNSP
jgi:hypothetical protein